MIISKKGKQPVMSLLFVGSLFMLTGCWGKKEAEVAPHQSTESNQNAATKNNGEVLLSIDGKPVLYVADYEDQKMMAQQSNQQLNMILQMIPDAEYSMLFKSIEAGHLMKEWVIRAGIDQQPDLVKQRRQYHDAIDLQLYMKYYEDAHPVNVTEHEALAFYKAKRDQIPGLIVTPAGVDIVYVNFSSKEKAEDFADKIKDGAEKHIKAVAKEMGLSVDAMHIAADSAVNDALKNTALVATKFPSKEVVKIDDNAYWVVGLVKKSEGEYRSFETPEIKQGITKMCQDEKRELQLRDQVEKLGKQFNVVENMEYFNRKKQNQAHALQTAEKIVRQAQQQAAENDEEDFLLEDKI